METQRAALSVEQAATFLGYTQNYLYKLIHEKKIPHFKPAGLRGRVFFKQTDLENFIFRNRQGTDYETKRGA